MKTALFTATLWLGALGVTALAEGTPKIQFEQTVYDFGATSRVATVSGVFKFKNAGDGLLKIEPPKPTCGCTVAELKPDTLAPGATGELAFTLHLGPARAQFEKHIAVKSNDPQSPEVALTLKADYTPLHELNPMTLAPMLAFGVTETNQVTTLTRTDGQPLRLARLEASKPWITATVEPGARAEAASARIRVRIRREGAPRRFSEFVQVYTAGQTNTPAASIYVYGQMLGEVSLSPEALYWSVPEAAPAGAARPEALATRRVMIRSANGRAMALKNPQSTVKGVTVALVPAEAGQAYELVARLEEVPASTLSGTVSFETSVAAQPKIEVPVIVHVSKR